jgi:glycosyltransferase involved in cell wall biosynthesis
MLRATQNSLLLSIIIPVYNCEQYIEECLASLYVQISGFTESVEIIIINDGSTDNTDSILKIFGNENIVIITKERGGVSSARNVGIRIARGKYIAFVDGDDWVSADYISKIVSYITENNEPDIVVFGICRHILKGKSVRLNAVSQLPMEWKFIRYPIVMKSVFNKVFKISIIKEHGVYFAEHISAAEDLFFVFQVILYASTVFFYNDILYHYRLNYYSVTQNLKLGYIENTLFVTREIEKCLQRNKVSMENFLNFLKSQKIFAKKPYISEIKFYNYKKWLSIFPEVNNYVWRYCENIFEKMTYVFIRLHIPVMNYLLALTIYYLRKGMKRLFFIIDTYL